MRMKLDEIKFLEEVYPRDSFENEIVNNYRLNLDELPPILVQKQEKILIDGYHRLIAHRVEGKQEIDAEFLDIPKEQILWEATKRNSIHGLQLKLGEKRRLACRFFSEGKEKIKIAGVLAIRPNTVTEWTKKLQREKDEERDAKILEWFLRCVRQKEIAKEIGVSEGRMSQLLENIVSIKTKEIQARTLDSLRFFNVWNFSRLDPRYGLKGTPGQIPGQIVENTLYYYTKPFDTVIDPMAGGGTTIDVCKAMYRRYRAYDLNPLRDDIKKFDVTEGFPNEAKNCDLIFLDPPYYKKLKGKLPEESVSSLKRGDFISFMKKLGKGSFKTVKSGGAVALLISDYLDYGNEGDSILSFEYASLFKEAGLTPINHISVPLGTQQWSATDVQRAKEKKILLEIARDLFIFKRV